MRVGNMCHEEWVALIGYSKSTKLFLIYGGRSVHIPKRLKPEHCLTKLLGIEAMQVMCDQYPSELLFVPRIQRIINLFKDAMGVPRLKNRRKAPNSTCPDLLGVGVK